MKNNTITDELMLKVTQGMPMKQIDVNGKPYLQRYYAGTFIDNAPDHSDRLFVEKDLWLHRFMSADGDRHKHSHPFEFETIMLCGSYVEETHKSGYKERPAAKCLDLDTFVSIWDYFHMGIKIHSGRLINLFDQSRKIDVFDWHRIAEVSRGTWTAVIVDEPRLPFWYFMGEDGELEPVKSSPRDWWREYGIRRNDQL